MCLYSRRLPELDVSVSASTLADCQATINIIKSHLTVPLNDLGIIRKFNGESAQQTRWFIKISCKDYILKILMNHQWHKFKALNLPLPMRSNSKYQRSLELAERPISSRDQQYVQDNAGFSYCAATGELMHLRVGGSTPGYIVRNKRQILRQ
jgi:hypothetical protein